MKKFINKGGINGTGNGVVNINSQNYKDLQRIIQHHSKKQMKEQYIDYQLIGLKLKKEVK